MLEICPYCNKPVLFTSDNCPACAKKSTPTERKPAPPKETRSLVNTASSLPPNRSEPETPKLEADHGAKALNQQPWFSAWRAGEKLSNESKAIESPQPVNIGATNHLALAALICSITVVGLGSIAGIVCGSIALRQYRKFGITEGQGMAKAGMWIGWIGLAIVMLFLILHIMMFGLVFGSFWKWLLGGPRF